MGPGRRAWGLVAIALVVVTLGAAVWVVTNLNQSQLVWADEFAGGAGSALSSSNWTAEKGYYGDPYHSRECMTSNAQNSHLDGAGHLDLVAIKDLGRACGTAGPKDYTSARLTTHGLHEMKYGYLEIRARMASGQGMWSSLWMLGSDYSQVGWPRCGEIDLSEVVSRSPTTSYSTVHGPTTSGAQFSEAATRKHVPDLSTAFHTYSLSWTPAGLTFAFDNWVYLTLSRDQVEKRGVWVFDHPFDILMDLKVGGDWPGPPTSQTPFPQTMSVDYVRVYSRVPKAA